MPAVITQIEQPPMTPNPDSSSDKEWFCFYDFEGELPEPMALWAAEDIRARDELTAAVIVNTAPNATLTLRTRGTERDVALHDSVGLLREHLGRLLLAPLERATIIGAADCMAAIQQGVRPAYEDVTQLARQIILTLA